MVSILYEVKKSPQSDYKHLLIKCGALAYYGKQGHAYCANTSGFSNPDCDYTNLAQSGKDKGRMEKRIAYSGRLLYVY